MRPRRPLGAFCDESLTSINGSPSRSPEKSLWGHDLIGLQVDGVDCQDNEISFAGPMFSSHSAGCVSGSTPRSPGLAHAG